MVKTAINIIRQSTYVTAMANHIFISNVVFFGSSTFLEIYRLVRVLSDNVCRIFCHTKATCNLWTALDQRYATVEKGHVSVSIND